MSELVVEGKKQEYSWVKYIRQRISQNKNMLLLISGQTGSGKSWSGLELGQLLDPEFSAERVIFRGSELMKLINSGKLKAGSVIVWDEAGIDLSSRNWQSVTNKMLNYLLQTFRHRCFVLVFTCPYSDFLDKATRKLFHAEFRTVGIDFKERKVKVKPQAIQYNSRNGNFYYKYLRIRTKEKGIVPIESWAIPAPSKELIDSYELKKRAFTDGLNKEIEASLQALEDKNKPELTEIQEEIVQALINGKTAPALAKERGIALKCVYDHMKAIKKKGISINPVRQGSKVIAYEVQGYA